MIKAYWWKDVPNFGDALAPFLLKRFANLDTKWASPKDADVISIGSVLEHIPANWHGYVLGSGRLKPDSDLHLNNGMHVLGLRGPLSAECWSSPVVLGDPGLLADELVGAQSRTYDLGIVPHWTDKQLITDKRFVGHWWSTLIINPRDNPLKVIAQIGSCKKIVTSSLHGLIVSDAFGIPRRFECEYLPRFEKEGGLFKFKDYSASLGANLESGVTIRINPHVVGDVKDVLWDAYRELGIVLRR